MASGLGVNQGKTAFVRDFFSRNRDASDDAVNQAWNAAGHEGTISESLIGKQRRKAGLAGTSGTEGETPAGRKAGGAKGKVRSSSKAARGRPSAETAGPGQPQEGRRVAEGGPTPAATAGTDGSGERERVLDRVEDGIDDLIIEVKRLGGLEAVLEALRKARRVVVRSHEG